MMVWLKFGWGSWKIIIAFIIFTPCQNQIAGNLAMKAGQFQEADRLYSCSVRRHWPLTRGVALQTLKSVEVPMVERSQSSPLQMARGIKIWELDMKFMDAILFWTHVVKCIPFVLWAFQFLTICRACRQYLFSSSSETFEMCYLDMFIIWICLLFGSSSQWRYLGKVQWFSGFSDKSSPGSEKFVAKKNTRAGPTVFFWVGWGGGESMLKHTSIYKVSQGWRIKHINSMICIRVF